MHPELYPQIFSVQTSHWWGRNRRELSLDLLKRFGARQHCHYLDIGCGTGQNLGFLDSLEPERAVGIDVSSLALEFASKARPHCELIQADINGALPFPEDTFDVETIFGVLNHEWVESEIAVLQEAWRVLKRGGLLLVTEPAFPALSRALDVAGMTKRRYRLKPFVELLEAAKFDVLFSNYFTSFGAPIILGTKALKQLLRQAPCASEVPDMRPMNAAINAAFYGLARMEAQLVKASIPIPFGTTIICVGRRR